MYFRSTRRQPLDLGHVLGLLRLVLERDVVVRDLNLKQRVGVAVLGREARARGGAFVELDGAGGKVLEVLEQHAAVGTNSRGGGGGPPLCGRGFYIYII